jgi:starch phosphorylase
MLEGTDTHAQDAHDADQLFRLLEEEVIPLFYHRDLDGVPRGWLQIVKESIKTIAPRFCTKRMVKEYMGQMYAPATARTQKKW